MINNFINIFREIKEMGWRNYFYRMYYEIFKRIGFFFFKFYPTNFSKISLKSILFVENRDLLYHYYHRRTPRFLLFFEEKAKYKKIWQNCFSKRELIKEANKILDHKINIFNLRDYDFGKKINWHKQPQGDTVWPLKHWSFIDIFSEKMGDIKYSWELNRCQHFFVLGMAYWITYDEKYAEEFAQQLRDWMYNNRPEIGIHWVSSLEIAIRLVSLIFGFYFFLGSKFFDEDLIRDFLKMIFISTRHIEKNLNFSRFCMPNDHLIGEATALFLVGMLFPEFKKSKLWGKKGSEILWRQLEKQVFSDGVHFFCSINYQRFVMECYILAVRLAEINNIPLPSKVKDILEKMNHFISSLLNSQGRVPILGDNDSSKLLRLDSRIDDFRPVVEDMNMLIKGKPFFPNNLIFEETLCLFGEQYMAEKRKNKFLSPPPIKEFPVGGYYILHKGNKNLIFRCGTIRSGSGNLHADALHFVLMVNDKYVILDTGSYLYNEERKWRDYFKGTAAHNTVVVDNQDQMVNWRKFKWLRPNKTKLIKILRSDEKDYIEGEHYGYCRFRNPVIHCRSLTFSQSQIKIVDKMKGKGIHQLDLYLHFPKEEWDLDDRTKIFTLKMIEKTVKVIPADILGLKAEVKIGSENPVAGWYSSCYGCKEPCITLRYSKVKTLPETFVTTITFI